MIEAFHIGLTLISFMGSILLAHFILRHKKFSYISNRSGRYGSIDGLRGFLAISVFFHHFIITWYWKNTGDWKRPPEDYFQNFGKVGVAIFFMITGFLFISKLIKDNGKTDWLKFFESRLFRIFPLFIFVITVIAIFVGIGTQFKLNVDFTLLVQQYAKWLFFHGGIINDYLNTKLIIAGVDWTLKYEWLFYLSLPFIALIMRFGKLWVGLTLLVSIFLFKFPIRLMSISTVFFILFAIGGFSAYIFNRYQNKFKDLLTNKVASTLCLLLLVASLFYPRTLDSFHIILISLFFILVVLGNDMFGLFSLKQSVLLGEISYSIYLLHGIVLYLLFSILNIVDLSNVAFNIYLLSMPFICILIVIVSSITFTLIENPSISFGRKYVLSGIIKNWMFNTNKSD